MSTLGFGTKMYRSTNGSTYAEIANVIDVNPSNPDATVVKTSNLSTTSNVMTKMSGHKDPGNWSVQLDYAAAGHATLLADWLAGTMLYWRFQYADFTTGSKHEFQGFVKQPGVPSSPEDDRMTGTAVIEVSGVPTFTTGS